MRLVVPCRTIKARLTALLKMKKITIIEIFKMYLQGRIDAPLAAIIRGWFSGQFDREDVDRVLAEHFDRVAICHKPTRHTYLRYRKLQKQLGFPKEKITAVPFTKRLSVRIAAVLLPFLFVGGVLWMQIQIQTQPVDTALVENPQIAGSYLDVAGGTIRQIVLPDSSMVIVNGNSRMTYSADFSQNREVYLEGEAFFKVRKNTGTPFVVTTKYATIEVTGTEFNVHAVPGENKTTIALVEGSVQVTADRETVNLLPMQQWEFDHRNRQRNLTPMAAGNWWTEPIAFRDQTLDQMFQTLGEYYNVSFEGLETITDRRHYNIKFAPDEPLTEVLDILKRYGGQFDYTYGNATVTITN